MTKIPLVTFFLAQSAIKTYPQTQFVGSSSFGDFFCADFIFPFPLNPEIFATLQEGLKGLIKEAPAHQIMEMLPKIAKDFLHHHAKKELAQEVPFDANTVFILILGKNYYLTRDEITPLQVYPTLKLVDYLTYENEEGDQVTRIYGVMAEDMAGLKEKQKLSHAFFHRPITARLEQAGFIKLQHDAIAFTTKAMKFYLDIVLALEECLKQLEVNVVLADQQDLFLGQANIMDQNFDFDGFMPLDQKMFTQFLNPFILLDKELDSKKERKKLLNFLLKFIGLVKQMGLSVDGDFTVGQDLISFADEVSQAIQIKWKSFKAKSKMQMKLRTQHRLGLHLPLIYLTLDQKNDKDFLKIELPCHPYAFIVWQEDKKNG